ncbi:MAG: phage tail protein [Magnetospirillum sp.]|nr:phage tail protein [Magnetospirillum sp.]
MSELYPVFTSAGLAAIEAAHAQGLSVKISHLALGDGAYDVRDVNGVALASARARVALDNERVRVALSAGGALGNNQVLVEAIVAGGAPEFWIKEIGFVAEDGTLLCIWSSAISNLGYRGAADWVFRYVLAWTDLPADAITVVYDGDAAYTALSIDHERLEGKVRHTVAAGGIVWADADDTQLTAAINTLLSALAPLASPALTGTPTAPTAAGGTNTAQLATTAFVQAAIAAISLVGYARLDTVQQWIRQQSFTPAALVDAATIAWDLDVGMVATVTISTSRTLGNPDHQVAGGYYGLEVTVGAGGAALAFGPAYTGVSGIALSTTLGAVNHLVFRSNGANMHLVGWRAGVGA